MLSALIAISTIVAAIIFLLISTRHRLVVLDRISIIPLVRLVSSFPAVLASADFHGTCGVQQRYMAADAYHYLRIKSIKMKIRKFRNFEEETNDMKTRKRFWNVQVC